MIPAIYVTVHPDKEKRPAMKLFPEETLPPYTAVSARLALLEDKIQDALAGSGYAQTSITCRAVVDSAGNQTVEIIPYVLSPHDTERAGATGFVRGFLAALGYEDCEVVE